MMLLSLNLTNPQAIMVDIALLLIIVSETIDGYKKGFFESSIRLVGLIIAVVGAYILKNPLSVFLYTHLPFFKFKGLFSGVSILNVLLYEAVSFIICLVALIIILNLIAKITGLIDKILSVIFFIGLPSKILGGIVGFVKSIIILYFVIFALRIGCSFFGLEVTPSLADDITNIPILKETFNSSLKSLEEITSLAKDYETTKNKEEYNGKAIDILLDYKIITQENLDILINSGKISRANSASTN